MSETKLLSPYKGLTPYTEEDAPFFFGRDAEVEIIIDNLMASRLTLLYGPSGVGKSSILQAGVAHQLKRMGAREAAEQGTSEFTAVIFSSWRDDPLRGLITHLEDALSYPSDKHPSEQLSISEGTQALQIPRGHSHPGPLLRSLTRSLETHLFIIFDQFEEYFLYHGKDQENDSFARELPWLVNTPDLRTSVLISIREDALAKLDRFQESIPNLFSNNLRIEHLTRDAAHSAIENPIKQYNLLTTEKPGVTIEPELTDQVLHQIESGKMSFGDTGMGLAESAEGGGQIEAPYLQLVMTRLWEEEMRQASPTHAGGKRLDGPLLRLWREEMRQASRALRLETLTRLGGVRRIVETHLDETMRSFPTEEQNVAAKLFHHLVTPSGAKIAHRVSDLANYTQLSEWRIAPVLEKLASREIRVLRRRAPAPDAPDDVRYEIFHDVLADAILDWRSHFIKARPMRVFPILSFVITALMLTLSLYTVVLRKRAASSAKELDSVKLTQRLDQTVPYSQAVMRGHQDQVNSAVFSPDSQLVVTASNDGTARVWEAKTGELIAVLLGHMSAVNRAEFSLYGRLIVTASNDGSARTWDTSTGRQFLELKGHTDAVTKAIFSPDSKLIATASRDGTARIWDAASGQMIFTLQGHTGTVTDISFSHSGQKIVTTSTDGTGNIWERSSGRNLFRLVGPTPALINSAVFSPDGRSAVFARSDGSASLWDVTTGRELALLRYVDSVHSARFSLDGNLIVTASNDRTAIIWNVRSQQIQTTLVGHTDAVFSAAFSPDGSRVITASGDHTARVWEASTGKTLFVLRGHIAPVVSALFSADGNLAVTASADATARVWKVKGEQGER